MIKISPSLAIFTWLVWALFIFVIGVKLFPDKDTKVPFKKVLISVGYAHAPGILRFFAVTPDLLIPIIFITQFWIFAALIISTRQILNFKSNDKGVLPTHVIRFWETQFKQIKPKILNSNRRYYDEKTINLLKKVKFLLKDQGMTIKGVKKILNNEDSLKLDEIADKSIRTENLRNKLLKISNKLKELKNGKKNAR